MNKKGQIDIGEIHPLAVVAGIIGAAIGLYTIKVMGGGGFAVGEANYQVGLIWKILIPICCAGASFFMVNKMFE